MNRLRIFASALLLAALLTLTARVMPTAQTRQPAPTPADSVVADTPNEASVIDEVVWVVGDEPILKSDIETMRLQAASDGVIWDGDPDCVIPEQLAVQKLFLHQAAIDSIEVTESDISQSIEDQINYWIQLADGSKEKLEEYRKMSIAQMRQSMHDEFKNRELVQKMKMHLVQDLKVSPAEVRRYFQNLPEYIT